MSVRMFVFINTVYTQTDDQQAESGQSQDKFPVSTVRPEPSADVLFDLAPFAVIDGDIVVFTRRTIDVMILTGHGFHYGINVCFLR